MRKIFILLQLQLKWRVKCQENETDIHCQYLKKAQKDVADLKQRHASTVAKIMEQRRKFDDLSHRILQVRRLNIFPFKIYNFKVLLC